MIQVFTTKNCAFCPTIKKYLTNKGIAFTEVEAYGEEHAKLTDTFGVSVPLTYNTETGDGVVGVNMGVLNRVIGVSSN